MPMFRQGSFNHYVFNRQPNNDNPNEDESSLQKQKEQLTQEEEQKRKEELFIDSDFDQQQQLYQRHYPNQVIQQLGIQTPNPQQTSFHQYQMHRTNSQLQGNSKLGDPNIESKNNTEYFDNTIRNTQVKEIRSEEFSGPSSQQKSNFSNYSYPFVNNNSSQNAERLHEQQFQGNRIQNSSRMYGLSGQVQESGQFHQNQQNTLMQQNFQAQQQQTISYGSANMSSSANSFSSYQLPRSFSVAYQNPQSIQQPLNQNYQQPSSKVNSTNEFDSHFSNQSVSFQQVGVNQLLPSQISQVQSKEKQEYHNQRAMSMGNIYGDLHNSKQFIHNQSCAVCMLPIGLVDDYTFTYHPILKYFCPTHKDCQKSLRRDSQLVVVPKFEVKAINENEAMIDSLADKMPRQILLDFEIQHAVSKVAMFSSNDHLIKSTVLYTGVQQQSQSIFNIQPDGSPHQQQCSPPTMRHLYFQKFEEPIILPSYMILIKIIWRRVDPQLDPSKIMQAKQSAFSKIAVGLIDLNEILLQSGITSSDYSKKSQTTQLQLDASEDATVELEFNVQSQLAQDGVSRELLIQDLSFILEAKDFSETSTTSSTFGGGRYSRHPSVDIFVNQGHQINNQRQYSIGTPESILNINNFQERNQQLQDPSQFLKRKANSIFYNPIQGSSGNSSVPQSQPLQSQPFGANAYNHQNFETRGFPHDFSESSEIQRHMSVFVPPHSGFNPMAPQLQSTFRPGPPITQSQALQIRPIPPLQPMPNLKDGEIIEKLLTKTGSKELQKLIERAPAQLIEQIVRVISSSLVEILIDQYGNYFCQKLFPKLTNDQLTKLIQTLSATHVTEEQKREKTSKKRLKNKILFVSSDSRGTHAIQSLIDSCQGKETLQVLLSELFAKDVLKYAYNKHATHVLIKFIKVSSVHPFLNNIYKTILENLEELAADPNGLPVIKNTIQKFYTPEIKKDMISVISNHVVQLSQNAYGNYALQVALEHWTNEDCQDIYKGLLPQLQQLSVQKFASNVIEKVLDKADQTMVCQYAEELSHSDRLRILVRVNYGYYVVERVLLRCHNEQVKAKLREEVHKNLSYIGANNLRAKWADLLEKSQLGLLKNATPEDSYAREEQAIGEGSMIMQQTQYQQQQFPIPQQNQQQSLMMRNPSSQYRGAFMGSQYDH